MNLAGRRPRIVGDPTRWAATVVTGAVVALACPTAAEESGAVYADNTLTIRGLTVQGNVKQGTHKGHDGAARIPGTTP